MNRRVTIVVVGLHFGSHILKVLLQPPYDKLFDMRGVSDLNKALGQKLAREYGVSWYPDFEAIREAGVEAIALMTPPGGRAYLIEKAVSMGFHVMTTKPLELNPAAALRALNVARERGRHVFLNSPSPVLPPDLALIRCWQQEYSLGRAVAVQASVWADYHEKMDGTWYDDPSRCPAAPILRLGVYLISDVVALLGEPMAISVMTSRLRTERPTADHAQLAVRFKNGALAQIFSSFCVGDFQHYRHALIVNFEHGTVYRNVGGVGLELAAPQAVLELVRQMKPRVIRVNAASMTGEYPWIEFHSAVIGQTLGVERLTSEEMVRGLRILEQLGTAESEHREVSITGN